MMRYEFLGALTILALTTLTGPASAAGKEKEQVMCDYETVSAALVDDNLSKAQSGAKKLEEAAGRAEEEELRNAARKLAASSDLAEAREHFVQMSREAIPVAAASEEEYFLFQCPMVEDGRWIQSEREIANPYMGQRMPRCGKRVQTITPETASEEPAG